MRAEIVVLIIVFLIAVAVGALLSFACETDKWLEEDAKGWEKENGRDEK